MPVNGLALYNTQTQNRVSIIGHWSRRTTQLLHELPTNAQESTVSELLGAVLQQSPEGVARGCLSLFVNGMFDLRSFPAYVDLVDIKLPRIGVKASQNGECFVRAVMGDEPFYCQSDIPGSGLLRLTSEETREGKRGSTPSREQKRFATPVGIEIEPHCRCTKIRSRPNMPA